MLLITRECPVEQGCSRWIYKYLKDCICSGKDSVSFSLGVISVLSWGIAEVPQIITNYKENSTEGVSLLFLMTWVVGDFFNLAGCLLEPATLPTQFYMALLYTLTTLLLVGQTLYYGRISKRRRQQEEQHLKEPLVPEKQPRATEPIKPMETPVTSQPISSISVPSSSPRQFYYTSARSLTRSHTPTAGSYLSSSGIRRSPYLISHPSLSNLQGADAQQSAPHLHSEKSEPILVRAVAAGLMMVGGYTLNSQYFPRTDSSSGFVLSGARRLLQEDDHSIAGECLGWGMAAIYMGGRLPQIWLNITRGTVEGLNPMMFFFALMGNATYVGSILVRSVDWNRLKPNMPWLVDAAVCVLLDFFILSQFCYYRFFKKCNNHTNDGLESGHHSDK